MTLLITTDYAIRIIVYLAQQGNAILTAKEIARHLGFTYSYFNKVSMRLRQAGFIDSVQGPTGGFQLARSPDEITLYDIIEVMEGGICLNRCMEDDYCCSKNEKMHTNCPVHNFLSEIQADIIAKFEKQRIIDFL